MNQAPGRGAPQPPPTQAALGAGRCHMCGYQLAGLPEHGRCPECGTAYTPGSARRLEPWPGAFKICCRLGWPILGLVVAAGAGPFAGLPLWGMMVAVPVNSYFQVRWMLKRSLPERVRTRGLVAVLRAIGTTICVVLFLFFFVLPVVVGIACIVMGSM